MYLEDLSKYNAPPPKNFDSNGDGGRGFSSRSLVLSHRAASKGGFGTAGAGAGKGKGAKGAAHAARARVPVAIRRLLFIVDGDVGHPKARLSELLLPLGRREEGLELT
jgi:hypothetical protein